MAHNLDRFGSRARWSEARKAETWYSARLRTVALQVGAIIDGLAPGGVVKNLAQLLRTLDGYSDLLTPWAESVARYMVSDVARRNERIWRERSKEMAVGIRGELQYSSQGVVFREAMDEQVDLIKSLPRKAGQRVHELTTEGLLTGRRAESISKEIMASSRVTQSRARLIARTEVSRTAQNFMRARAQAAGSQGYVWRTSKDADVRDTHKVMEGVYVPWDTPPKTDKNLDPYHAGCGPNCRCFAEPVLPDL